jgi:Gpi18-like mannosyltransferase
MQTVRRHPFSIGVFTSHALQLLTVLAIGLIIRGLFITLPGHVDDVAVLEHWIRMAGSVPLTTLYPKSGANYPPLAMLLFWSLGHTYQHFVHDDPGLLRLRVLLKLPAILADIFSAVVGYVLVRRCTSHSAALMTAAFIALNPALVYDSAYWGQLDAVPVFIALSAAAALLLGNGIFAWALLTCAILVKPPVAVLIPLFVVYPFTAGSRTERTVRFRDLCLGVLAGLLTAYATTVPFYADHAPVTVFRHLTGLLVNGSSLSPFLSDNAFNVYALFLPFQFPDTTHVLLVPLKAWAWLFFIAVATAVVVRYAFSRSGGALLEAAFVLLFALFMLAPEMHERYLVYALGFACVLVSFRRYTPLAVGISVTLLLNMYYGMAFMYAFHSGARSLDGMMPLLASGCAALNLIMFVAALWTFFRPQSNPVAATSAATQP